MENTGCVSRVKRRFLISRRGVDRPNRSQEQKCGHLEDTLQNTILIIPDEKSICIDKLCINFHLSDRMIYLSCYVFFFFIYAALYLLVWDRFKK